MSYIEQTKSPAVMDYLLSKLIGSDSLEYYLPQLCYLAITKDLCFQNIQNFIVDLPYAQNLILKSILLVQSWSEDNGA